MPLTGPSPQPADMSGHEDPGETADRGHSRGAVDLSRPNLTRNPNRP
jgi:hypothetical protein